MGAITATTSQGARPFTRAEATTAPAPSSAIAAPIQDRFVRQTAQSFAFPGLVAGKTFDVKGDFKGNGFGGTAIINTFDGTTLDLTVNASAMLGLVRAQVHVRLESNSDGTVTFLAERTDRAQVDAPSEDAPNKAGARMKVLTNRPGLTVLQAPNGNQVTVSALPGGGLHVAYDRSEITLNP